MSEDDPAADRGPAALRLGAAALAVTLMMASLVLLPHSPAAAVVPPATKTVSIDATFSTSGQSLWGPGNTAPPATQSISLFDESWNATDTGGAIEAVDLKWDHEAPCFPEFWLLCPYTTDFGHIGDFGATGTGASSGRIGMSVDLEGVSGGTLGVTYPVKVNFTTPADKTFGAGDTIEIGTSLAVQPGASIHAEQPNITGIAVNGTFGFHARFNARVCIFECFDVGRTLLDVPEASGELLSVDTADIHNPTKASPPDTYCFGPPENLLFGLTPYHLPTRCAGNGGYLARPAGTLTTTTNADGSLSASGHDTFVTIPVSAVTWMGRAAGLPFFPPLNLALTDLGGTGTDLGWTTTNLIFNTDVSRAQSVRFTPQVDVTLAFPRALSYRVLTPANVEVSRGTGTSATLRAGNKIRVDVPVDQTGPFEMTPSLSLTERNITNRMTQAVRGSGRFEVLSLTFNTPSATFDTGFGLATVWPGTDINLGPVYDVNFPLDTTTTNLLDHTWSLGGFNAPALAPFSLVPAPPPVVTPVTIHPVEGAALTATLATFTDEATHAVPGDYAVTIDWGDGTPASTGTITGSNGQYSISGTHTYQQYGPRTIGLVLTTVPSGQLATNRVALTTSAAVADAVLTGAGTTNNVTVAGQRVLTWPNPSPPAPNNVVATFTDANPFGLLSDLSATIDWGDGSPATPGVVSGPTGGPFSVTGAHDYTDLGLHDVTVRLVSKGGSRATAATSTLSFTNPSGGGTFLIGDKKSSGAVTFWGSQWHKANDVPQHGRSSFKGYANQSPPACGSKWSANFATGNSSTPPGAVPAYMAVGMTNAVSETGFAAAGDTTAVVIVKTDPGYGPDPSRTGTGTVVAVLCRQAG